MCDRVLNTPLYGKSKWRKLLIRDYEWPVTMVGITDTHL